MSSLKELINKAEELKSKGLTTYEIAEELKIQPDTVVWLLLKGKEKEERPTPYDVFVDWNPLGSGIKRLALISKCLSDLIQEAIIKGEFEEPDVIVGIEGEGLPLGLIVAEELNKPLAIIKPRNVSLSNSDKDKKLLSVLSSSFSPVEKKKALIIDSVVTTGNYLRIAMKVLNAMAAKPVGIAVMVDKTGEDFLDGVPIKALIRLHFFPKA
ncbi:MAG: orotate phosphoribosyltransferase-like protein [Candidatus Bathyarchaeia archaeon]